MLIADTSNSTGWQFAEVRVLNTLIGAGLAFGSHYFIWPNWERDRFPRQLAIALRETQIYFSDVMSRISKHCEQPAFENWRSIASALLL